MAYGYRSGSGRYNRGNFHPSRGRGSSFRGRGRGSDSYYSSGNRDSYTERSNFRNNSYRGSSFRSKDNHYESRGNSRSRYSGDRYTSSRGRRDEESSHHRRDMRESASGSFGREHSRRNDGELDRKRMKSDAGSSFKEGYSPRRSYDELEHSSRHYNSMNSSPYRSDSSPFGAKSYKKEFNDFKKPMTLEHASYSSRRPSRGVRGRGGSTRIATSRIVKVPSTSYLKRGGAVARASRLKTASRLQLILRKKKQLRIMRMRKEREERLNTSSTRKLSNIEDDSKFSDIDVDFDEDIEDDIEEMDTDIQEDVKTVKKEASIEKKEQKKLPKVVKKESENSLEKSTLDSESPGETEKKYSPMGSSQFVNHIPLKCPHCKSEHLTFRTYHHHLSTSKHKIAMEKLLYNMKQKLRRLRTEQRDQQRIIDERDDNFNRTSYCKLCKLNFKQTRQEHMTSDYHICMSEFLNSKCSVCRITFATPILYEHHRCTLNHIKRKAFLERKGVTLKGVDGDEDNNDDGNFMVLDSVGSADESNEEDAETPIKSQNPESSKKKTALETKKKTTIIGKAYIKKVSIYYCKLCKLCLHYNPNRDVEECLLIHCRTRFHLKRYSLEEAKKEKLNALKNEEKTTDKKSTPSEADADVGSKDENGEENEQFWLEDENAAEDHKSSEDEDDSHSGNRYDRFSTSDEKDNVDKAKIESDNVDEDQEPKDEENAENKSGESNS